MLNFLGLMGGGMPSPHGKGNRHEAADQGRRPSLADMLEQFDFSRISLGGPVFDLVKLKWLNGEYLRKLTPEAFLTELRQNVFAEAYLARIAPLIQTRIETLAQTGDLADFFFRDEVIPAPEVFLPKKRTLEETLAFTTELLTALETADWTLVDGKPAGIDAAIRATGTAKEWSVKENFMLLRAILTGSTQSPPLLESLEVFGKARSLDRIRRFLARESKPKR